MKELDVYLKEAVDRKATDIFIVAGNPVSARIDRKIVPLDTARLRSSEAFKLIGDIYAKANMQFKNTSSSIDDEIAFNVPEISRFRVGVYKQQGSAAAVLKVLGTEIPTAEKFNLPDNVMSIANMSQGLVILSGSASSGISTTLACIIDRMNKNRDIHIVILEDTIEYSYIDDKAIISQREILRDSLSYSAALKASMRQSPDVIIINSFRDNNVVDQALSMAELGYLVIAVVNRLGVVNAVKQIIKQFPDEESSDIALRLSNSIRAIISEQLVTTEDNKVVPVFDAIFDNDEMREAIKNKDYDALSNSIINSNNDGAVSMNNNLKELFDAGVISEKTFNKKRIHRF